MQSEICAVVLNYNHASAALRAAAELRTSSGVEVDVLIVDCASNPADRAILSREWNPERLLLLADNLGYSGGMNAGFRFWRERGIELPVLFFTPDAELPRDAALKLYNVLKSDERIGACGPVVVYREAPNERIGAGGEIRAGNITLHDTVRSGQPYDAGWIEGCCVLLRARAFEEVGGFDEAYFMYFEEIDLCERLRRKGWRIVVAPDARVRHPKASGQQPPHYYYYMARNGYRFWNKNFGIGTARAAIPLLKSSALLLTIAIGSLVLPNHWREARGRWKDWRLAITGMVSGTHDHIRKRYGAGPMTRRA